jgi:hypothetical protein
VTINGEMKGAIKIKTKKDFVDFEAKLDSIGRSLVK